MTPARTESYTDCRIGETPRDDEKRAKTAPEHGPGEDHSQVKPKTGLVIGKTRTRQTEQSKRTQKPEYDRGNISLYFVRRKNCALLLKYYILSTLACLVHCSVSLCTYTALGIKCAFSFKFCNKLYCTLHCCMICFRTPVQLW